MNIAKLATIAVVIGLTACATTEVKPYRSAPQVLVNKTQGTVNLNIPQQEIEAIVPIVDSSAAVAQYGLVGLMVGGAIDASTNSSNVALYQKLMAPIQDKLLGFNFDGQADKMVKAATVNTPWFEAKNYNTTKKALAEFAEPTVNVTLGYRLSTDLTTLIVIAEAEQHNAGPINEHAAPTYKNKFAYFSKALPIKTLRDPEEIEAAKKELWRKFNERPEHVKKDKNVLLKLNYALKKADDNLSYEEQLQHSANQWLANDAQLVKQELSTALADLAVMIKLDLADPTAPLELLKRPNANTGGTTMNYEIVQKLDNRQIVRNVRGNDVGTLCSISLAEMRGCQ
jgi:hypothetical protein